MSEDQKHSVLSAKDLAIGYKTNVVASSINFELKKGCLVGLIGANGIGKSTLIKTLINAQPQLSGELKINSSLFAELSGLDIAKQLSVVLTEPLASKNILVSDLVALGRQPYTNWIGNLTDNDVLAVTKALELVNGEHLKDKKCYELSDGELQKVMIARALAQDTDIIILDEPTTHLDMHNKASVLKLLKQLTKETNKTILYASHEIDLAIQLCDSMLVMQPNKVTYDSPENLINDGVFKTLFPEDIIQFDETTKRFVLGE